MISQSMSLGRYDIGSANQQRERCAEEALTSVSLPKTTITNSLIHCPAHIHGVPLHIPGDHPEIIG
jgi:hypothetical protein